LFTASRRGIMAIVKGNWLTYSVVAGVLGVLTLFMVLLYNWQAEASTAERERMQRRVETDTKNFANDFNREVQAAFFNFQGDPELIAGGDATEIGQRFDYWKANTEYPDLINGILYIPRAALGDVRRFDQAEKSLEVIEPEGIENSAVERIRSERRAAPVFEELYTLVVPIHAAKAGEERIMIRRTPEMDAEKIELPAPEGYIAVFLDESVIKEKVLPSIAAKHFPTGDYTVVVKDRGANTIFQTSNGTMSQPDAKAALFDLTPDSLIFFSNRELLPRRQKAGEGTNIILDQRVERRAADPANGVEAGETFTVKMKEAGRERTTAVVAEKKADSDPWQLSVHHTAGSIDAYIQGERYKNLAIGLGIYLLLVGSILAIVFSSLRAKAFAQRQIDFVSSVSHEFRTPLAVIYSAGENLADGVARDGEQVSRYGDLIKGEGKKLSAMVEQILEFAGARSGKRKYNLKEGDVSAAVEKALSDSKPLLEDGGFDVETDLSETLPATSIDREGIETAVRNLIQNAVKYSNGSRWVRVATENGGGSIKIVVEDRGIGISDQDKKKIFEPFFRSKGVVDAQIHGNGLGLSLVKEIAEAHRGRVSVDSELDKGSRFVLELPLAK
jgi:signal transduction histidine kinase